jgi:hypothetical protein
MSDCRASSRQAPRKAELQFASRYGPSGTVRTRTRGCNSCTAECSRPDPVKRVTSCPLAARPAQSEVTLAAGPPVLSHSPATVCKIRNGLGTFASHSTGFCAPRDVRKHLTRHGQRRRVDFRFCSSCCFSLGQAAAVASTATRNMSWTNTTVHTILASMLPYVRSSAHECVGSSVTA